jgi:hypothetical protein
MSTDAAERTESTAARSAFRAAVAASVVLHAAIAWPLFEGKFYTYDDLTRFHLPMRLVYSRALAAGLDTAWTPEIYAGFPLQAEAQIGMDHPWHLALYRLLPLPVAFMLELVVSYPLLQLGMYRLLRRWPMGRAAAALGSLQLAFCGSLVLRHVHMNLVATLAHVPWLLWAADHLLRGRSWWAGPAVALLTTSQILIGHPQSVVYGAMIEGTYALVRVAAGARPGRVALLALAKALGVLGGATQLVPLVAEVGNSVRSDVVMSLGISRPEHAWNVAQWFAPYLFRARGYFPEASPALGHYTHEAAIYVGSVAPVLLIWIMTRGRPRRQLAPLIWGMTALAIVGLVLTFIETTPLVELYRRVPVVRLFRVSARYFLLVQFALAVFVAVAFDDLVAPRSSRPARLGPLAIPTALAIASAAGAWLRAITDHPDDLRLLAPMEQAALGIGLAVLAWLFVAAAARGARGMAAAVVILTAADLGGYGLSFLRAFPVTTYDAFVSALPRPPSANAGYRIRMSGLPIERATDVMVLAGQRLADGYAGLIPRRTLDLDTLPGARLAGVGWTLELGLGSDRRVRWTPVPAPLPRARLLARAVPSDDPAADLARIDTETVGLVPGPIELDGGSPGTATIERDDPGRITVATDAPARRLLVVAERFHDGWTAAVDDEPAAPLRVYGEFLGIVVEAGRHRVVLRFEPMANRVGRLATFAALGLLGAWTIAAGWLGRRSSASVTR